MPNAKSHEVHIQYLDWFSYLQISNAQAGSFQKAKQTLTSQKVPVVPCGCKEGGSWAEASSSVF